MAAIKDEFLQKLAPCIERGDLDACVEEAARVAGEMGVEARELLELSSVKGKKCWQIDTRALDLIKNIFNQTQP